MIAVLIAFPVFGGLVILQSAIVRAMPLLQGNADLILLVIIAWALQERVGAIWQWTVIGGVIVSLVSGLPLGFLLAAYLVTTTLVVLLRKQIWKAPYLAMWVMTFLGTVIVHAFSFGARLLSGVPLPLINVLNLITMPSILLNLLLAAPIYAMVRDVANWLYPEKIEV